MGVLGSWRVLATNRFEISGARTGGEPSGALRDRRAVARDTAGGLGRFTNTGHGLAVAIRDEGPGDHRQRRFEADAGCSCWKYTSTCVPWKGGAYKTELAKLLRENSGSVVDVRWTSSSWFCLFLHVSVVIQFTATTQARSVSQA